MGKRGPKKGHGGRPRGSGLGRYAGGSAKAPAPVREYWRMKKAEETMQKIQAIVGAPKLRKRRR